MIDYLTGKTEIVQRQKPRYLEQIAELGSRVSYNPMVSYIQPTMLNATARASRELPEMQQKLENALNEYQSAAHEKLHPYSLSSICSRIARAVFSRSSPTIEDLYKMQTRCFARLLEVIEDIACQAQVQESNLSAQTTELSEWLDKAQAVMPLASEELGSMNPVSYCHNRQDANAKAQELRQKRDYSLALTQLGIVFESRNEMLPALREYLSLAGEIAYTVLTLKAHTVAAAEYFERTLSPARFLDTVADAIPNLEKGIENMQAYHSTLRLSISKCTQQLSGLSSKVVSMGIGR